MKQHISAISHFLKIISDILLLFKYNAFFLQVHSILLEWLFKLSMRMNLNHPNNTKNGKLINYIKHYTYKIWPENHDLYV